MSYWEENRIGYRSPAKPPARAVNVSDEMYNRIIALRDKTEAARCEHCGAPEKVTIRSVSEMLIEKGFKVLEKEHEQHELPADGD